MMRGNSLLAGALLLLAVAVVVTQCRSSGEGGGDEGGSQHYSSITSVEPIPPGDPACEYGGQRIYHGIDENGNGLLDPSERDGSVVICNGAPGLNSLVKVTPEPIGPHCDFGGQRVDVGLDDDRDGVLDVPDEVDNTFYVCNGGIVTDADGDGYTSDTDCDDSDPGVNPGADEVCDGADNDCDGKTDEGYPKPVDNGEVTCDLGTPIVACEPGFYDCNGLEGDGCETDTCPAAEDADGDGFTADEDCDDSDDTIYPGASELCDGLDNDCDSVVDEQLTRQCGTSDVGACSYGVETCTEGVWGACEGAVGPSAEQCNGLDDDCDGETDEGNPGGGSFCSTGLAGICNSGTYECSGGALTCVQDQAPQPEQCNGLDDDCDGSVDEGNPGGGASCNTGQPGVCADGTYVCSGGGLTCVANNTPTQETCGDGLDNDCDGVVDNGCP